MEQGLNKTDTLWKRFSLCQPVLNLFASVLKKARLLIEGFIKISIFNIRFLPLKTPHTCYIMYTSPLNPEFIVRMRTWKLKLAVFF